MSLPEIILWDALRRKKLQGLHFRRQHPSGRYVLDFYCHTLKLAVEIDGDGHSLGDQPMKDATRDAWLQSQGIRTLRLSAGLVLDDVDDAVRTITSFAGEKAALEGSVGVNPLRPFGPPPPEGEDR